MLNHLHGGCYQLHGLSTSDDVQTMRRLLSQLKKGDDHTYYCGAAATVARCMTALLAITPGVHLLTGDERLCQRPVTELVDALRGMGLDVSYDRQEGYLPLRIVGGKPRRKMAFVDPSRSSQFVTALMLVGPELEEGITVVLTHKAASRPYIEMTRQLLLSLGIAVEISPNGRNYMVEPRSSTPQPRGITIEGDWTAASYFYAAAAILPGHRLRLRGIASPSLQGDSIVDELYRQFGVVSRPVKSPYHTRSNSITIVSSGQYARQLRFNFVDYPDLLPTVAVTCAALGVNAHLSGIANTRLKESDRVSVVAELLSDMGCRISISEKEMHILPSKLHPIDHIDPHNDHRIAMAFAPLLLRFPTMTIDHPEVVNKSFSTFWTQFDRLRRLAL